MRSLVDDQSRPLCERALTLVARVRLVFVWLVVVCVRLQVALGAEPDSTAREVAFERALAELRQG